MKFSMCRIVILSSLIFFIFSSTYAMVIPSDDEITIEVQKKLVQDPVLKGLDIKISTQNGEVTLNGNVSNQVQVDAAIKNAKSITGVKNVNSYIISTTSDCQISINIEKLISRNDILKNKEIKVSTLKGVVTLTGVVDLQSQIDTIISLVKEIPGVVEVKSEIAATNIPPIKSKNKNN